MNIIDVGTGPAVILVPGVQGRWEWMKPAVHALARQCRVVTFSFADEPTCGGHFDPGDGFSSYVEQIGEAMDQAGIARASICGVSYGGLVAAAFCARHPERVTGLVLVSAIPPSWTPNARVRFYLRAPRLLMPLFLIASVRMYREIAAATPGVVAGLIAAARHGLNALAHICSPSRMARRVYLLTSTRLDDELRILSTPVLVITGEATLDNVVPVRLTEEYVRRWPQAERVTLARTGHLGLITRPDLFAAAVGSFVQRTADERTRTEPDARRRRVG